MQPTEIDICILTDDLVLVAENSVNFERNIKEVRKFRNVI